MNICNAYYACNFVAKSATWFSENEGGVKGCSELFQKIIRFGNWICPLACFHQLNWILDSSKHIIKKLPSDEKSDQWKSLLGLKLTNNRGLFSSSYFHLSDWNWNMGKILKRADFEKNWRASHWQHIVHHPGLITVKHLVGEIGSLDWLIREVFTQDLKVLL